MTVHSRLELGKSVRIAGVELLPVARCSRISFPFLDIAWLRPVGVQLRREDGTLEIFRIRDRTRFLQFGLAVLLTLFGWQLLKVAGR